VESRENGCVRTRIEIPPLYCPIPPAIHPGWRGIGARTVDWMASYGFCEDPERRAQLVEMNAGEWVCRAAPHGTYEGLQIFSDSVCFDLAFDDAYLDAGPMSRDPGQLVRYLMGYVHAMDNPEARDGMDPVAAAYRDIVRRQRAYASPVVLRRRIEGATQWYFAAVSVVAYRALGAVPTLNEYLICGPRDRACRMSVADIEMAERTELPDAEMDSPHIRALTQAACTLETFDNDLFSFARETRQRAIESNLISVLAHRRGIPAQQAVTDAVALRDRIMCLYLELRDQSLAHASAEVKRYLDQLDHLVRGNLDWSLAVPRYGKETGALGAGIAVGPSDGTMSAPPIPAIAWWWDLLNPRVL
jgi:hypothetical protein